MIEVRVEDGEIRTFGLTFGLGRNLLRLENCEERFGLITAMNLVNPEKLRSLDSNRLDVNPKVSRIQLGKSSEIVDFELDKEYDIIKSISGSVEQDRVGDALSISGKQSLAVSVTSDIQSISDLLSPLFSIYLSESYKEKFPGVLHTREVKDKTEIDILDNLLVDYLQNNDQVQNMSVVLALPEIIKDEELNGFNYGNSRTIYEDLNLSEMMGELSGLHMGGVQLIDLKNDSVHLLDENGGRIRNWKIYKCLLVDCNYDNHQYVLNDGKWYMYDDDYAANVNAYYNSAPISSVELPDCGLTLSEKNYNITAANGMHNGVHWDCDLLNPFNQTPVSVQK